MSLLKVSLSAGHGLYTRGKQTPDGMKEWDFNSAVVKYMMQGLALYQNVAVLRLDDPTGKTDPSLQERSDRSTAWGANVHIDVHANAYGTTWNDVSGIETFVYSDRDIPSMELASVTQVNLVKVTKLKDRGVKEGNLHMVREPRAKAKILVEAGFMTNRKEAELLKSDAYRRLVANCIVDALVQVYDLKKKEEPKEDKLMSALAPVTELKDNQKRMMARLVKIGFIAEDYKPNALDLKYFSMFDIMARKVGLYDN